jgi:hypothetical protein
VIRATSRGCIPSDREPRFALEECFMTSQSIVANGPVEQRDRRRGFDLDGRVLASPTIEDFASGRLR